MTESFDPQALAEAIERELKTTYRNVRVTKWNLKTPDGVGVRMLVTSPDNPRRGLTAQSAALSIANSRRGTNQVFEEGDHIVLTPEPSTRQVRLW